MRIGAPGVERAPRDGAYERFREEATPDRRGGRGGETEGREKDEEMSRKRQDKV